MLESWREARGETGSIRLSSINCKLITISNGLGVSHAKGLSQIFLEYGRVERWERRRRVTKKIPKYESLRVFFYQMLVTVIYLGPRQTLRLAGSVQTIFATEQSSSTKNCSGRRTKSIADCSHHKLFVVNWITTSDKIRIFDLLIFVTFKKH